MVEEESGEAAGEEREDGLLAAAEQLAGVNDGDTHRRSRRGRVRRRGRLISEDGSETLPAGGRVRSTSEETGHGPAPESPPREMLDANGEVIARDSGPPLMPPPTARAMDAGAVLADAARSYLEGLDARGADNEVTKDRLDRLRRTLEQYDQAT